MYTITVEASFSAVHRLRYPDGVVEPLHGHDWVVHALFARPDLDDNGMVVDFHQAQQALQSVVQPLHHTDLNENEAIGGRNPTAEVIARHVYLRLHALGMTTARRVEVTEAPGCVAAYEPPTAVQPED